MKNFKRILSLLLVLVMLCTMVCQLASCGGNNGGGDEGGNTNPPDDGSEETATYTISVQSIGGLKLKDILVELYCEDGSLGGRGVRTDANGIATFTNFPKGTYKAKLSDVPNGYIVNSDGYDVGVSGTQVTLVSSVISDTDTSGVVYQLGDIMHDFTVTTIDGSTWTLSEVLKEKDAVLINFWYTTCTYCISEFPDLEEAYKKYADDMGIIAINGHSQESVVDVQNFVKEFKDRYYTYYPVADESEKKDLALTFPVAKDSMTNPVEDPFEAAYADSWGNPVSIVVDRYGVISMIHLGALPSERYFNTIFEYFTAEDYKQTLVENVEQLVPVEKPDVELPENYYEEVIKDVLVKDEASKELITFAPEQDSNDAEYAWPFVIVEKNGEKYVTTSNTGKDNSYSILHAKVSLKAGEAIVFEYFASMQTGYDYLYVLVDDEDIYSISSINKEWKKCCPYVATEDGVYDVVLLYYKDMSDESGEDAVHVRNFYVVDKEELDTEAFIPREAATKPTEDMSDYTEYVTVVLGDDGYYHVGTKDGPILIASLLNFSNFTDEYSVSMKLYETYEEASDAGKFMVNGVNKFNTFIQYCNYASNSNIYGYCSVTEELKGLLDEFVKQNAFLYHENTWLQLCSYFEVYGKDENGEPAKQLGDIIAGLASFSAPVIDFVPVIDDENPENNVLVSENYTVTVNRVVMPRGYLYSFTPAVSGVYRITTNSTQEVDGWIFVGGHDEWIARGDRILYLDGDQGERHCEELLVQNPDGSQTRDYTNVSMVAEMEAGKTYYITLGYYDVYATGSFTFNVKFVGHQFDMFQIASPGPFTYEETVDGQVGDLIVGGINVELGKDNYYYHRLTNKVVGTETVTMDEGDKYYDYKNGVYYDYVFENGTNKKLTITIGDGKQKTVKTEEYTLGSLIYADFYFTTNIFTSNSLTSVINNGGFNFAMTELDNTGLAYLSNNSLDELKELWGADYEYYYSLYQLDDLQNGIYHGRGQDYTAEMREYVKLMENDASHPERQGCVKVDKRLGELLQMVMDKYTFQAEKSWTKLCFYYNSLGYQE